LTCDGIGVNWAVSIHAPTRGATQRQARTGGGERVSIHAPTRGATSMIHDSYACRSGFNPRAHAGRDCERVDGFRQHGPFQSTRPRGARQGRRDQRGRCGKFQSTRPRGARRCVCVMTAYRSPVSIHAPTRGATASTVHCRQAAPVSIHAPTRGATVNVATIKRWMNVSIHAPTRGATDPRSGLSFEVSFQSTRPRGARHISGMANPVGNGFNPRAHAGRDSPYIRYRSLMNRFNPRAHAGRDIDSCPLHRLGIVSIHAPTRGATARKHPSADG